MISTQTDNSAPSGTITWMPMDDGLELSLRRWKTTSNPRAIVHIVHGMGEHSLRYANLAKLLNEKRIEVWAADQRGHGETAKNPRNEKGKGGLLGHCHDEDGLNRVTLDIDTLNRAIKSEYPGVPVFLLGHSWGSFIAQNYIEKYEAGFVANNSSNNEKIGGLSGCILSGTRGPDGIKIATGAPFLSMLASFRGSQSKSRFAKALVDGSYNKAFKPNRTEFDWLSRDENVVNSYIADPLCGFLCSLGFYRDMALALKKIHLSESMANIRKDLPIYIFSGSADPVGDFGESPAALVVAYRHLGIKDLESVFYPDARHETLNETNRSEVQESLLSWILRHCA